MESLKLTTAQVTIFNETFYSTNDYNIKDDSENVTEQETNIYDVPIELAIFLSICYCCVSLCAVIGNSLIIWIVLRSPRMRSVTNYFIANLAFADILIGAFAIPFQFQAALLQQWDLPHFMCFVCPTVQVISVNVSVFTLTAIALDRYRAVIHPLQARTTKLKTKFIIITIWVFSIFVSIPTLVAFNVELIFDEETQNNTLNSRYICHNTGLSPELFKYFNHLLVVLQYAIPLAIISYAYIRMCLHLWRDNEAPVNSRVDPTYVNRNKKRVIKMLFIVVALFCICWLPFQMYNILQEIYPEINRYTYINLIWFSCHFLAMSNSCYNPFIYAIYSERFNAEFRYRFGFCCCLCCQHWGPHRSTNSNTIIVTTTTTECEQSQWFTHSHHTNASNVMHGNHKKKRTLVCIPGSSSQSSHTKKSNSKKMNSLNKLNEIKICSIENINDCNNAANDQVCDINSIACENNRTKNKMSSNYVESSL